MSTVIKLKKSESALNKPSTLDIESGEVAINALDQRIFVRDSNDKIVTIGEAGAGRYESSTVLYTVTVASKDSSHVYNGQGSGNGYKIDGSFSPYLKLLPGNTYRFDQSDASNSGHPLRFYYDENKTTQYTTGVTTNGTAGNNGAYTEITPDENTPLVLYYQCTAHPLMGWAAFFHTRNLTGFDTDDLTEGSNLYYTTARANSAIDSRVDKSFVDALNIDADTLDSQQGSYYLDYDNFTNTPTIPSDVSDLTDTTDVIPTSLLDLSITDGSNGQVLTTDGAGNFSFTTVSGGGGGAVDSVNSQTGTVVLDTDDISEGSTNLYFTTARANTAIDNRVTKSFVDNLSIDYDQLSNLPSIPSALTDLGITDGSDGQVLTTDGAGNFTFTSVSGGGAAGSAFTSIAVSGQDTVQSDSATDTLNIASGGLVAVTTNASTDTITISTPSGLSFTKSDGTEQSLEPNISAGTLGTSLQNLHIPFSKADGTSQETLVLQ